MMFIFSSTYYELFKQNILNACCYPVGHLMRVRYEEKYVPASLRAKPEKSLIGKSGVFVFAEGAEKNKKAGANATFDYRFIPIRRCKIKHAQNVAGIIILDLQLQEFLDYGNDTTWEDNWDRSIKAHKDRPFLKNLGSASPPNDGFYVYGDTDLGGMDSSRTDERAWRSVIDRINRTELAECVTYRVMGFFSLTGFPVVRWFKPESRIEPSAVGPDPIYQFRTGETILMKLLFYGQANKDAKDKVLKLEFDTKTFTSASTQKLNINGHYNEERVLLPTSRGTDTVVSTLGIVQDGDGAEKSIWAPQPRFVVSVGPPWWVIPLVASLFTLSFLLASVTSIKELPFIHTFPSLVTLLQGFASLQKPLAAISFMAASWIYLRKFPLK